jgi:hypothetical protein
MLSGTGYPSGENYPAGTGMELIFYPHACTGNPTGKILRVRVRVRVSTTRRVRTRCHLESVPFAFALSPSSIMYPGPAGRDDVATVGLTQIHLDPLLSLSLLSALLV